METCGKKGPVTKWLKKKSQPLPVTPKMLVRTMVTLQELRLFGVYFGPCSIAQTMGELYPSVDQDKTRFLNEVRDKLLCAATADIIGFKPDSGYHLLTQKGISVRIDTRSELLFWMLYKQIKDERAMMKKKNSRDRFKNRRTKSKAKRNQL